MSKAERLESLRSWNGEDIRILKSLLDLARADPAVSGEEFRAVRREIHFRYSAGRLEDYIRGGRRFFSLIAVDTLKQGLIATPWGDGPKDEEYEIYEPLPLLTLPEHLERISALLNKKGIYGRYDNYADALRLLGDVVGDIPITSLDELEEILSLLRETHDRIYDRILHDLENLELDP